MQVFDNHGSHRVLKQLILGCTHNVNMKQVAETPFFSDLTYEPLPESAIGNLSFQQAYIGGQAFFCLNGPAHVQKNIATAFRSGNSLFFADFLIGIGGLLELGVPPPAYCGYDSQSDHLAAVVLSPWLYVTKIPKTASDVQASPVHVRGH